MFLTFISNMVVVFIVIWVLAFIGAAITGLGCFIIQLDRKWAENREHTGHIWFGITLNMALLVAIGALLNELTL